MLQRMAPAVLLAAIVSSGCGGSDSESASKPQKDPGAAGQSVPAESSLVGQCTTSGRELVPCSDRRAVHELISTFTSPEACSADGGFAPKTVHGTAYCIKQTLQEDRRVARANRRARTQPPAPPPAIGRCTNFDLDENLVGFDVKFVDCDSDQARSRIVSESHRAGLDCEQGSLDYEAFTFCIERLEG